MKKYFLYFAVIFLVPILVLYNDEVTLVKAHEVTIMEIYYGEVSVAGGNRSESHDFEYIEIKSTHNKKYKVFTRTEREFRLNEAIKIYEYKRSSTGVKYYSFK